MIKDVLQKLDLWILKENQKSRKKGIIPPKKCEVFVIGQAALMEANLDIY